MIDKDIRPTDINHSEIAIISFVTNSSHLNYGATLHGYAFQKYLKFKYNTNSTIIDYLPRSLKGENLKYPIFGKWGKGGVLRCFLRKVNWILGFNSNIKKWIKFKNFIRSELVVTNREYDYSSLKSNSAKEELIYNIFVCEADVIWKIFDLKQIDDNFFLNFPAAKDSIKVAYAPTISSKVFAKDEVTKFLSLTESFYAISAREKKASVYLREILHRNVSYVLDPTLLLDEKDYQSIIIDPKEKDEFLLIYNCTVNDIEMVKSATIEGKKRNLKVIEISNYSLNRFIVDHEVKTDIGIEEWLGYFQRAKLIFTNSFHGICFSIIFKRNFLVFERDKNDFRMMDIMDNLNISGHLVEAGKRKIPKELKEIDYNEVYLKLNKLRDSSNQFIYENIIKKTELYHNNGSIEFSNANV